VPGRIVGNPNCNLSEINDLVDSTKALTIRLLRAANSAFSASGLPVVTVREAVPAWHPAGPGSAVAPEPAPFLLTRPAYGLDEGALWRHSVAAR